MQLAWKFPMSYGSENGILWDRRDNFNFLKVFWSKESITIVYVATLTRFILKLYIWRNPVKKPKNLYYMYQQFSAAVITFLVSLSMINYWASEFFQISSFGILVNIVLVMSIRKTVSMNGSFGIITKNQAICNIMMCSIFLVFVFPTQVR